MRLHVRLLVPVLLALPLGCNADPSTAAGAVGAPKTGAKPTTDAAAAQKVVPTTPGSKAITPKALIGEMGTNSVIGEMGTNSIIGEMGTNSIIGENGLKAIEKVRK